jgi:hypothetical protein
MECTVHLMPITRNRPVSHTSSRLLIQAYVMKLSAGCFISNATLTTTILVRFDDIKELCFVIVRSNLRNSFTADAENVHHVLEDSYPPILACFWWCSVLCFSSPKFRGLFENEHVFSARMHHLLPSTAFAQLA